MHISSLTAKLQRFLFLIVLLFLPAIVICQSNAVSPRFSIVKPLMSRNEVENIFKQGEPKKSMVNYKTAAGVFTVTYSDGGCDTSEAAWAFPEGLVEEVFFVPAENGRDLRLKDVVLNRSGFRYRRVGDVLTQREYFNDEIGIFIGYDTRRKTVTDITIQPTVAQKSRYECHVRSTRRN